MDPLRGSLLAALLCLVHLSSSAYVDPFDSPHRCVTPPAWSSAGQSPMLEARGNVTVVALLQASCSFCRSQASSLEGLRLALSEGGMNDINFMVVNSGGWLSRLLSFELSSRVSFPVYEEGYFTSIWDTLQGGKDDILVYDRCGFLTYQLRMPYSALYYPYVESAIRVTYHGDDPCNCNLTVKETTTMAPAPSTAETNTTARHNNSISMDEVPVQSGLNATSNTTNGVNASREADASPVQSVNITEHEHHNTSNDVRKCQHHSVAACRELRAQGIEDSCCCCCPAAARPHLADNRSPKRPAAEEQLCGSCCCQLKEASSAAPVVEEELPETAPCESCSKTSASPASSSVRSRVCRSCSEEPAMADFCGQAKEE